MTSHEEGISNNDIVIRCEKLQATFKFAFAVCYGEVDNTYFGDLGVNLPTGHLRLIWARDISDGVGQMTGIVKIFQNKQRRELQKRFFDEVSSN